MAYPSSVISFSVKVDNDDIEAEHINTPQTEIAAIEDGLLNGFAHILKPSANDVRDLGLTGTRWKDLYLSGLLYERARTVGMGDWTAYTPAITGFTAGNAVITGRYARIGMLVEFDLAIVWGNTTVFAGVLGVALPPVTAASIGRPVGSVIATDAGTSTWGGIAYLNSTSSLVFYTGGNNAGAWTDTTPFTWVNTDSLVIHGSYVAA